MTYHILANKSLLKGSSSWIHPLRMQSDLTYMIEGHIYNNLFLSTWDYHRVILTALGNHGCSDYLTVLPTHEVYHMHNAAMRLAIRLRLGLLPFDQLHNAKCNFCPAQVSFNEDPHHLLSCNRMGRPAAPRHDTLLVETGKMAGLYVEKGTKTTHQPEGVTPFHKGYDNHADILMTRHADLLYIDVQVTNPTAPSAKVLGPLAIQNIPIHPEQRGIQEKEIRRNPKNQQLRADSIHHRIIRRYELCNN